MKNKKLVISVIIFIIISIIALLLIINKGHIGKYSLVSIESNEKEKVLPKLTLELEKNFLSSKDKEDKSKITVMIDNEIITQDVEFEISDEEIIKVNEDNEIIPIEDGRATIKAKYDGLEVSSEIQVITPIKTMSFTSTNSTIRVNKDLQLKLKVTPSDSFIDKLEYTSSDESIAIVNANGIVTGISEGKVTITVYDPITEIKKSVELKIKK